MADTIIFRGAYIRKITKNNSESDTGVRIEIGADWTDTVREHMEWDEVPHGHGASDLIGKLRANHMILTPADNMLKKHEVQIDIDECSGFNQKGIKDGEGNIGYRELLFAIDSSSDCAAALAEGYVNLIGRGKAQLKVSYVKQEEIDLQGSAVQ